MELKAAGIKDISFYHYEDDGDGGVFAMEKYGDPEKYEKSFEENMEKAKEIVKNLTEKYV